MNFLRSFNSFNREALNICPTCLLIGMTTLKECRGREGNSILAIKHYMIVLSGLKLYKNLTTIKKIPFYVILHPNSTYTTGI